MANYSGERIESNYPIEESAGIEGASFNPSIIKYLTAGYGGGISSVYWVGIIFDYAEVIFDGSSGANLPRKFEVVSNLDTNWAYPNIIAAWALPDIKGVSPRAVFPFLETGSRRFPQQWKFRVTWAQYILSISGLDSARAYDSAATVLLPLSAMGNKIPEYARNLAFTLLHKNGKPEQAMSILLQTYEEVPDPLVRFQFQNKIADLLERNEVRLGVSDSTAFFHAIGGMLDSKDASQVGMAKGLLVRLVQPEHKAVALAEAHQLAEQFKVYQKQAAAGR